MPSLRFVLGCWGSVALASLAAGQDAFVNWESAHVHPLELTPDGARLLAVNTAAARLEVFALDSGQPVLAASVPVGLDPISVRARSPREAWVVNKISDSVSVVDLETQNVVATLRTDDEPADVVFAGEPARAYVSCSQANTVLVFDPAAPNAPLARIAIDGEAPRALAVSADEKTVYVAIFESGNGSTVLGGGTLFNLNFPPNVVSAKVSPYSGRNPPPNTLAGFEPPLAAGLAPPPKVGLIVKKNAAGEWRDDFLGDWTHLVSGPGAALSGRPVGWDLTDHDVALLDTASGAVRYARGLMNACMALAVNPASGELALVGTDATNEVRFEPRVRGRFLRVRLARVAPSGATLALHDLNPHLAYERASIPPAERVRSLGDPRALVWNAAGTQGYVAGMGSNSVVAIDAQGARTTATPIAVGAGPTGLALDAARGQLYVLCRFEATLTVVELEHGRERARVPFFDPTPAAVRAGRRQLYDTQLHSGLGHIACASCHLDARTDHLAWDLGDPSGAPGSVAGNNLAADNPLLREDKALGRGAFEPFHPMKGPMSTQTLQAIIGTEPLHWRGDRAGLEAFAGAFVSLQGGDAPPSATELQALEDFLATIAYPPNPFRGLDNELPTDLALSGHFTTGRFGPAGQPLPNGNAPRGLERFRTGLLDNGKVNCVNCHTLPTGLGPDARLVEGRYQPLAPGPLGERHHMLVSMDGSTNVSLKVPQLRNLHEKVGFELTQSRNHFGFGFLHDGSVDSLARFLNEPQFTLESDQDTADLVAFLLCFSGSDLPAGSATNVAEPPGTASLDTHAAVGRQTTLAGPATTEQLALLARMRALAEGGRVGLIAKGRFGDLARGWCYTGAGKFQSDRAAETVSADALSAAAHPGAELTFTLVPKGSERRFGIDRDADGVLDRDELERSSLPGESAGRTRDTR